MIRSTFELIPEDRLEKMVKILKAIAHPLRLQIVNILLNSEYQVGEMVQALGTGQSLTSQELGKLKLFGVLKSRREGNKVYYSLKNNSIRKILATIVAET
ncbi:MAG TPA: metalloregulator ArsR/SmtB family transcription factor [Anaerolineae bacterium]|nr:metalloregulator ArsR/SmtB family transcription factor [Anaerolineae bacterium]